MKTNEQIDDINAEVSAEQAEEAMVISRDTTSEEKPISPQRAANKEARALEDMMVRSRDHSSDSIIDDEEIAESEAGNYEDTMVESDDQDLDDDTLYSDQQ